MKQGLLEEAEKMLREGRLKVTLPREVGHGIDFGAVELKNDRVRKTVNKWKLKV